MQNVLPQKASVFFRMPPELSQMRFTGEKKGSGYFQMIIDKRKMQNVSLQMASVCFRMPSEQFQIRSAGKKMERVISK
jgi:hypothetical protein